MNSSTFFSAFVSSTLSRQPLCGAPTHQRIGNCSLVRPFEGHSLDALPCVVSRDRFLHFIKRVDLPFHQESLLYVLSPINTTSLEARPNFRLISSRNCAAAPICEFVVDFHSQSGSTEQAALS